MDHLSPGEARRVLQYRADTLLQTWTAPLCPVVPITALQEDKGPSRAFQSLHWLQRHVESSIDMAGVLTPPLSRIGQRGEQQALAVQPFRAQIGIRNCWEHGS